jgi:hypothetical protein
MEKSDIMCNSEILPSWKDLMSRIVDDDIFPRVEEADEEEVIVETETEPAVKSVLDEAGQTNTAKAEEEPGYSEWGMLITGSTAAENNAEGNAAVQPIKKIPSKSNEKSLSSHGDADDAFDDEENSVTVENAPPPEILSQLKSLRDNLELLRPKIDKFITRLTEVSYEKQLQALATGFYRIHELTSYIYHSYKPKERSRDEETTIRRKSTCKSKNHSSNV